MTKLAFDLDGVLYDWHRAVHTEMTLHWKLDQTYDDFWNTGWKNYSEEFWKNMAKVPFLYSNMIPSKRQMDFLKHLNQDYEIFYITNRPQEVLLETQIYLDRHKYPNKENLYFTNNKDIVATSLVIDFFVEDRSDNVKSLDKVTNVIVMKQPWNNDIRNEFTEINNIFELEDLLNG